MIGQHWKHKVRGHVYEIVSETASLQMSCDPEVEARYENDDFVVYRNVKNGAVWIRPTEEFMDGRFERVDMARAAAIGAEEVSVLYPLTRRCQSCGAGHLETPCRSPCICRCRKCNARLRCDSQDIELQKENP
jgi:hypothetical protein